MYFPRMKTALAVVALLAASQAGSAVPGFAGNVTGGGSATPVVTQAPQRVTSMLTVSPPALFLVGNPHSVLMTVTSNVPWTVSGAGFVTVSPTFGSGNGTFILSVTANNAAPRTAVILVTGGGLTRSINVTQTFPFGPAPIIDVTPNTLALQAGPSVTTLRVFATVPWNISLIPPWLTFTPVFGGILGSNSTPSVTAVTMTAEANPNSAQRTALVQFLSPVGVSRTFVVIQAGQAPPDGPVAATAVTTSSGPWFTEEQVRLSNTAPITQLTLTITVQRTAGVTAGGLFNTVGGGISGGITTDTTEIRYTFHLNAGQTLAPGIVRTFAAQLLGSGTAHPTSGDTYVARGVAGGREFTLIGTF